MANAWITFLTKYYADRKKREPGYSYRKAMKDAKSEYNKSGKSGPASAATKTKKGRKMKGGSEVLEYQSLKDFDRPLTGEPGNVQGFNGFKGGKGTRRKGRKGKSKKSKSSESDGDLNSSMIAGGKSRRRRRR